MLLERKVGTNAGDQSVINIGSARRIDNVLDLWLKAEVPVQIKVVIEIYYCLVFYKISTGGIGKINVGDVKPHFVSVTG